MRGLFVTFEGIDRSGKTTQARLLTEALGSEALGVREPGGTPAGERVRDLLKDAAVPLGAEAEALLFAAARAELVAQVIRPALEDGRVVVSDRFLDSSLAYQGAARGLGVETVLEINATAVGDCIPDLSLVIDTPVAAAAWRRSVRLDRIEAEGGGFQARVAAGYRELAERFPGRVILVPGEGTIEQVHARVGMGERLEIDRGPADLVSRAAAGLEQSGAWAGVSESALADERRPLHVAA